MLALNFHRLVSIFTCIPTHPPGGSSKQLTHGSQHRSHGMTPSRCPNCGFASLFLYPSLLSRMRVGVWDTSTLFVQVDFSKAGRWNMAGEPPLFRQRAERSGTSPLRHLLQLEGCLRRTARRRAPCGGCQNISRLPQATEYQEYLAGTETVYNTFETRRMHQCWWGGCGHVMALHSMPAEWAEGFGSGCAHSWRQSH